MTAEEFLINKDLGDFRLSTGEWLSDFMIEFAQYHVEQALKEASESINRNHLMDYFYLDLAQENILTAYPKEKIQ